MPAAQHGFSLFVVTVTLLLVGLLALAASRTARLDEMASGNDSDHQHAFERAQALLREAEAEILAGGVPERRHPASPAEWIETQAALVARAPSCAAGLCVPDRLPPRFWSDEVALAAMKQVAAVSAHGWYWIELLPYDRSAAAQGGAAERLAPDAGRPFIHRVTVLAEGRKPATRALIQATLVLKKTRS